MKSILIADDSTFVRLMISNALENIGFNVSLTCNGEDALDTAQKKHHDLVITDLNMPVMDGLSLVEKLRKLPAYENTPIIFLTSENDQELKEKGRNAGASGWVVKPFNPDHHVPLICKCLDCHEMASSP